MLYRLIDYMVYVTCVKDNYLHKIKDQIEIMRGGKGISETHDEGRVHHGKRRSLIHTK